MWIWACVSDTSTSEPKEEEDAGETISNLLITSDYNYRCYKASEKAWQMSFIPRHHWICYLFLCCLSFLSSVPERIWGWCCAFVHYPCTGKWKVSFLYCLPTLFWGKGKKIARWLYRLYSWTSNSEWNFSIPLRKILAVLLFMACMN